MEKANGTMNKNYGTIRKSMNLDLHWKKQW